MTWHALAQLRWLCGPLLGGTQLLLVWVLHEELPQRALGLHKAPPLEG